MRYTSGGTIRVGKVTGWRWWRRNCPSDVLAKNGMFLFLLNWRLLAKLRNRAGKTPSGPRLYHLLAAVRLLIRYSPRALLPQTMNRTRRLHTLSAPPLPKNKLPEIPGGLDAPVESCLVDREVNFYWNKFKNVYLQDTV